MDLRDDNGHFVASGELQEGIAFNYFGVNYLIRLFDPQKKDCGLFSIGLGYMGYNDRLIFDNSEYAKITASTLGASIVIGYDIAFSKNFGIGFKFSLMGGAFRNFNQTKDGITTNETLSGNSTEGLGTIKLSVGLRFNSLLF